MRWLSRLFSSRTDRQTQQSHLECSPTLESLEERLVPSGATSVTGNFNNSPVAAGSTLWLSSDFQANNLGNGPVNLQFTNQTISFTAGGTNYSLTVPDADITLSPSATVAATMFNSNTGAWNTTVPSNLGGNDFLSGVALSLPLGLPANVQGVTWSGQWLTDTQNVQIQWQWSAAAYLSFSNTYSGLNIKPCDSSTASGIQNGDHAGSPEMFTSSVVPGGTGNGGNNYTGNATPNTQVAPQQPTSEAGDTAISANFNNSTLGVGTTLWFNSVLQAKNLGAGPVTVEFTNQTISYIAYGTNYSINVPDATVLFSPTATVATTTYDADGDWDTTVPLNLGGNIFLSGVAVPLPNGVPANIQGVTWSGQMQSDRAGAQVQWQWSAADYSNFSTNYTTLNVKPCDDPSHSAIQNGDHAGTPEAFKASLAPGGTGNGGNNYTGTLSPSNQVTPGLLQTTVTAAAAPSSAPVYVTGSSSDYPFTSSNPLTSVAFNESDILRAAAYDPTNQTFEVWYSDEHAMTLGVNQVTVINANNSTTTTSYPVSSLTSNPGSVTNPALGYAGGTDPAGRPLAPSLYLTDITNNANSRSGDWQSGGTPIAPSAVFGTWKSYAETIDNTKGGAITLSGANDPTKNQWNLGTGADAPPSNLSTEGYTAEVRWSLASLQQQGLLIPGHSYRFYVMVHDGDQNKSGGDVGQASYDLNSPIPLQASNQSITPATGISGAIFESDGITGFAGILVTLTGKDNNGNAVNLSMPTGTNGTYSFTGLQPGNYVVTQTPPANYFAIAASVGTDNGTTDGKADSSDNFISGIALNAGDQGINYNFTNNLIVA